MEPLLGVKIGCLFALLVLTLACGLIPICFKWFQIDAATGTYSPAAPAPEPPPNHGPVTCPDALLGGSHHP